MPSRRLPPPPARRHLLSLVAATLACALWSGAAVADVDHVVGRNQTLGHIAQRYGVSSKLIAQRNRIRDPLKLQLGQVLVIPGVEDPNAKKKAGAGKTQADKGKDGQASSKFAARAKEPGIVRARRLATSESYVLKIKRGKKLSAQALQRAKQLMRSAAGQTHAIDPQLLQKLAVVVDHFGSRPIEVISGFRPFNPGQHTKDSRHNHGKAIDFRVVGVPNTVLRDFCRTLPNTGCGYYPNSVFVHMDARDTSTYWVDYSRPGERPRYHNRPKGSDGAEEESAVDVDEARGASPAATEPSAANGAGSELL